VLSYEQEAIPPEAPQARQVLSYEQEGAAVRVKKRVNGYEN
jgi:hypothetical protein